MLTSDPQTDVHRELQSIERTIADATEWHREHLARLEGQRDKLLQRLLDNEGCPDSRPTAVR